MTELLLATRSEDKAREIRRILGAVGIVVITLDQAGVRESADEEGIERFETFRENALAKARHFVARTGSATLADDSGLVVPALGGTPGVRSKRFSGRTDLRGRRLDEANNQTLLANLVGNPRRDAHYVCAAAFLHPDGAAIVALGAVDGRVAERPSGDGGFGYDPLFHVPALDRTFGQVDAATKDRMSHRARAFRALAGSLIGALSQG